MSEKQGKRELILQAARQVFAEKGYHASTSEEIARVAGVGKGTIYQYFASKKDIYDEVRVMYMDEYCNHIIDSVLLERSFADNIHSLVHAHIEKINLLVYIVTSDLHSSSGCVLENEGTPKIYLKMLEKLNELIISAKEKGELHEVQNQSAINYIVSIFMGMAYQAILYKRNSQMAADFSHEKWEEEIIGLLLHGLSAK